MATVLYSGRKRPAVDGPSDESGVVAGTNAGAGVLSNCRRWIRLVGKTWTYQPPFTTLYRLKKNIDCIRDPIFGSPAWKQVFGNVTEQVGASGPNVARAYTCDYNENKVIFGAAGSSYLPMYILDLTQRPGQNNISGDAFRRAWVKGTTKTVEWFGVDGKSNNDSATNRWQPYWASSQQLMNDLERVKGSLLKKAEIYLVLQGVLGQPTTFDIDFVQFKEASICPSSDAYDGDKASAFWIRLIHKYISSPIDRRPADETSWGSRSMYRVLASEHVTLYPKDTSVANSTVPNQNVCYMNVDMDHLCAWAYTPYGNRPDIAASSIDNPQLYNQQYNITDFGDNGLKDYRHRVFMLIRARGTNKKDPALVDAPQFDMRCILHHAVRPDNDASN